MTTQTILVTGSGRGIGRGIALTLAERGFSVAVHYAGNRRSAEETLALCRRAAEGGPGRFALFQGDISLREDRRRLLDEVREEMGEIHGLVNNAGIAPKERRDILDMEEDSFDRLMETNLKGTFFLSRELAKEWLARPAEERGPRSLLFITSVSSEMTSLNRGEYCIAKAGLSMAAGLFSARLAGEGVRVYEIRPGIIRTDMTAGVTEKYDELIRGGLVPQKRWGLPEDIGKTAAALLAGDLPYSTGSVIHVDGGLHMPRL